MAKIYYNRIKAGIMTIDDVPTKWRNKVQEMLDADSESSSDETSTGASSDSSSGAAESAE